MPNVQLWPVLEALPRTSDPVPCFVGGDKVKQDLHSHWRLYNRHNITGMTSFNVMLC